MRTLNFLLECQSLSILPNIKRCLPVVFIFIPNLQIFKLELLEVAITITVGPNATRQDLRITLSTSYMQQGLKTDTLIIGWPMSRTI